MQIRNNPPSLALTLGAIVGAVFYLTFGGVYFQPAIIMAAIGLSAFVIMSKTAFDVGGTEGEPSKRKFEAIAVLGMSGLFAFLLLNIFVPELAFLNGQATLTTPFGITAFAIGSVYSAAWTTSFVFNVFIVPPNEEQFFRVMIGNVIAKVTQNRNALFFLIAVPVVGAFPVVTMLAVGTIFASFHLAVYGLNYQTLAILWGAGSFLYWFDLRAGDPLPSIFAHMANNALAFLYSGNVLVVYFPSLAQYQPHLFLPLLQILPVLGMAAYVKLVKKRPLWGLTH